MGMTICPLSFHEVQATLLMTGVLAAVKSWNHRVCFRASVHSSVPTRAPAAHGLKNRHHSVSDLLAESKHG